MGGIRCTASTGRSLGCVGHAHAALVLALALLVLAPGVGAAAARTVPRGWLGVIADGPLTSPEAARFDAEWDRMAADGAESVRAAFYWSEAQPYATVADVPPAQAPAFRDEGGIPTDYARYDGSWSAPPAPPRRGAHGPPHPGWAAEDPQRSRLPPREPAT